MWHEDQYNDSPRTLYDTIGILKYWIVHQTWGQINNPKNITLPDDLKQFEQNLLSINCFRHACVFQKI